MIINVSKYRDINYLQRNYMSKLKIALLEDYKRHNIPLI